MKNQFNLSGRIVGGKGGRGFIAEVMDARKNVISRSRSYRTHAEALGECAERILDENHFINFDLTPRAYIGSKAVPCELIRACEVAR